MAVYLESKVKHLLADAETDELPRVGSMFEGTILAAGDLPVGSTVLYRDTGKIRRWNGLDWLEAATPEDKQALLLSAILAEMKTIKDRIALATA